MKRLLVTTIGSIVSARQRGATAVEYGIMVALIAAVIITAVTLLGGNLTLLFNRVSSKL